MDNKITINNKEYDKRDLTEQQQQILNIIQLADSDIFKAQARLELMTAGRQAAVQALTDSLESAEEVEPGEAND